jgi:urease beta subunit
LTGMTIRRGSRSSRRRRGRRRAVGLRQVGEGRAHMHRIDLPLEFDVRQLAQTLVLGLPAQVVRMNPGEGRARQLVDVCGVPDHLGNRLGDKNRR